MHRRPLHKGSPQCQGSVGRSRWYSAFRIRLFAPRRRHAARSGLLHLQQRAHAEGGPQPPGCGRLRHAWCPPHGGHRRAGGQRSVARIHRLRRSGRRSCSCPALLACEVTGPGWTRSTTSQGRINPFAGFQPGLSMPRFLSRCGDGAAASAGREQAERLADEARADGAHTAAKRSLCSEAANGCCNGPSNTAGVQVRGALALLPSDTVGDDTIGRAGRHSRVCSNCWTSR